MAEKKKKKETRKKKKKQKVKPADQVQWLLDASKRLADQDKLLLERAQAADISPEREAELINRALALASVPLFYISGYSDRDHNDSNDMQFVLARRIGLRWGEMVSSEAALFQACFEEREDKDWENA